MGTGVVWRCEKLETQRFYQNSAVLFTHLQKQTLISINSSSAFIYTEGKHFCYSESSESFSNLHQHEQERLLTADAYRS